MTEPVIRLQRPTAMKRTPLALATIALLASGCGQQGGTTTETQRSDNNNNDNKIGSCTTSDDAVVRARPVYEAIDLDHDGVGESLMVTRPDSTCPNIMFTKVDARFTSVPLKDLQLDLRSARRVIVPGRDGDLVAIREVHPRGGFQEHLYAYADGKLAEVKTSGGDLPVPFVATDTKGGYVSASCADGGFVVRQAVVHQPAGIVFAWDVRETAYQLDGATAKSGGVDEVKDNVLDQYLRRDFPELVGREMFKSGCGA